MKSSSKQLTSAIIAALFFAVALIVYFEMISPSYTTLQNDKAQALSKEALYQNEQQIVSSTQALIQTYNGEASSTAAVNMSLPVGQNVADAITQIYGIAADSNFSIQGISITTQNVKTTAATANITAAASKGGSIVRPTGTVSFQITGTASYENFKTLLNGLENNIRLFDVTTVSLQPTANANKNGAADIFNFTITVVTYYQSA